MRQILRAAVAGLLLVSACKVSPQIEVAGACEFGCNADSDCFDEEVCAMNGTCVARCASDADCRPGEFCSPRSACERREFSCVDEAWSANARGDLYPCFPYFCDAATGRCPRTATSEAGCVDRYRLEGTSCVPTMSAEDAELYRKDYWDRHPAEGRDFTCRRKCERDADCRDGYMCSESSECVPRADYCNPDNRTDLMATHVSETKDGSGTYARSDTSCGNYSCHHVDGRCNTDCVSDFDCDSGFFCDAPSRACVSFP